MQYTTILSFFQKSIVKGINFLKKKLLFKILPIFILAISIPAGVILLFSYNNTKELFRDDIIAYKENMNTQIAKAIDIDIKGMDNQSEAFILNFIDIRNLLNYTNETIDENYTTISDKVKGYLNSILKNNNNSDGIFIINIYGTIVKYANFNGFNPDYNKVIKNEWITQTYLAKGEPLHYILDLNDYIVNKTSDSNKAIAVTRALINYTDDSNIPIGISVFVKDLSNFGQTVIQDRVSADETIIILDKDNNMVFSNKSVPRSMYEDIIQTSAQDLSSKMEFKAIDNKNLFICNFSSSYGFKVISIIPEKVIEDKLSSIQKINIVLLLMLSIIVILLSIFLTRLVVKPLNKMMISFKNFEHGNFAVRIPVHGDDEFAEICKGFNAMVMNLENMIKEKYELNIHLKQAEIESLQSKINPHFLYNTLASMKNIIERNDFDNAYNMVQYLSDIFRYSLSKGNFMVDFSEELEHIEKYLWIQKYRFGDRYSISYDIDKDALKCKILRITLQPVVENALIHGLDRKEGIGHIRISAKLFRDVCNIYVEDDGEGISSEALHTINKLLSENPEIDLDGDSKKLNGIFNVNSRIKLYFGSNYGLTISSSVGKGTTVRITFPVLKNDEGGIQ